MAIIAIIMLFMVKKNNTDDEIRMVTNERGFTINRLQEDSVDNPVYEEPASVLQFIPPLPPRKIVETCENPPLYDVATTTNTNVTFAEVTYDIASNVSDETSS